MQVFKPFPLYIRSIETVVEIRTVIPLYLFLHGGTNLFYKVLTPFQDGIRRRIVFGLIRSLPSMLCWVAMAEFPTPISRGLKPF